MAAETGMPQLDQSTWTPQLFWLAVCFLALYFIVQRKVIPGVGATIANRKARIDGDIAAAQRAKAETDNAIEAYEAALADAKAKASAIGAEARARLDAEIDGKRKEIDAEIGGRIAAAETSIAGAKAKAMKEVKSVAAEIAGEIVTALTGARATKADIAAAVAKAAR